MEQLMIWYFSIKWKLHPIELEALLHFKFVYIHPFVDGNGRTARLLMNLILMGYGYLVVEIKEDPQTRIRYYKTLELASVERKVEPFVEVVANSV